MNSFIKRMGGKKLLRDEIIARFPTEFSRYVEVFGGAAWVLFRKDKHAAEEIYNDADGQLVNLFRCVKYHAPEVERQLAGTLNAREAYWAARQLIGAQGLTDIQRAAGFYTLLKLSFGANEGSFGCIAARTFNTGAVNLQPYQERLRRVLIEHKDCADLIRGYDKEGALFYCDPPYYGAEDYYTHAFGEADHVRLRDSLASIKGKFVLSYNDHPRVRELYEGFRIEAVERHNNLSNGKRYRELIIRNF